MSPLEAAARAICRKVYNREMTEHEVALAMRDDEAGFYLKAARAALTAAVETLLRNRPSHLNPDSTDAYIKLSALLPALTSGGPE